MSLMFDWPYGELLQLWIVAGLLFGLVFGLAMAPKFKGKTVVIEVDNKSEIVDKLIVASAELGYSISRQSDTLLHFKPSMRAGLAAGAITVTFTGGTATIIGPAIYVTGISRKLLS